LVPVCWAKQGRKSGGRAGAYVRAKSRTLPAHFGLAFPGSILFAA
jgi:hypothetical protein